MEVRKKYLTVTFFPSQDITFHFNILHNENKNEAENPHKAEKYEILNFIY